MHVRPLTVRPAHAGQPRPVYQITTHLIRYNLSKLQKIKSTYIRACNYKDIEHKDIEHKDIEHKDIEHKDIEHKDINCCK